MSSRLLQGAGSERESWRDMIEGCLAGTLPTQEQLPDGRLALLSELFGLAPLERNAVALLWVLAFDPELRPAWTGNQVGVLTPLRVATLFGHQPRVRLPSEGAALLWRILDEQPLFDSGAALALDPAIVSWLEGEQELDRTLVGRVRMLATDTLLPSWPLERTVATLEHGLSEGIRWRVVLETDDVDLGEHFAVAVGRGLSLPVMGVNAGALDGEEGGERALRLQRQAYLDRVALLYAAGDAECAHTRETVPFPLQFVIGTPTAPPLPAVRDLRIPLAPPRADERHRLWLAALPEAAAWQPEELEELSERHDVPLGQILRVAASAPPDAVVATRRLRAAGRDDTTGLVQRMESEFRWDDLVLPYPVEERLREIAFEARERDRLWAEPEARRLYPQGRGLVALFAGPPGTGKTMAAQVIAADLGRDLLRIDLSAVISKWVGETAQHLQQILSARASRQSLLFFDEADALYGKRVENVRDAQDRFANMDVSHLMVALESFDGIVLLATNLKANIDPAFIRRIRHVVDFPRPDVSARLLIWNSTARALFGPEQATLLEGDLKRVATIEASGAQIKNAALSALFSSRRSGRTPDARLLGNALARELAKDGAGLSERDLDDLLEART